MTTTIEILQQSEFLNIIHALTVCDVSFYYFAPKGEIRIDNFADEIDSVLMSEGISEASYQLYESFS